MVTPSFKLFIPWGVEHKEPKEQILFPASPILAVETDKSHNLCRALVASVRSRDYTLPVSLSEMGEVSKITKDEKL